MADGELNPVFAFMGVKTSEWRLERHLLDRAGTTVLSHQRLDHLGEGLSFGVVARDQNLQRPRLRQLEELRLQCF